MNDPNFRKWLRGELQARHWMPKDLSDASAMTLTQVVRVLKGEQEPGRKFLEALATALQYPRLVIYRRAGWLDDEPVRIRVVDQTGGGAGLEQLRAEQEELLAIFDQLNDGDQETLLWMARSIREKNKAQNHETKTKAPVVRAKTARAG